MNFKAVSNFNQSSIFLVLFHAGKVKQNHSNLLLNACRGIILPPRDVISQNQSINRLIQFKQSVKKIPSNFPIYPGKKISLNTYVFHRKSTFLYILSKMKALRGIILPETCNISLFSWFKGAVFCYSFLFFERVSHIIVLLVQTWMRNL